VNSADQVPGSASQFYAYCAVALVGAPVSCLQTDAACIRR
jgi:hypothetical protein